jgi:hypothetical protein
MHFCPICGRNHEPGPCPIPSTPNTGKNWESKRYLQIGGGTLLGGLALIALSYSVETARSLVAITGMAISLVGLAVLVLSRLKYEN